MKNLDKLPPDAVAQDVFAVAATLGGSDKEIQSVSDEDLETLLDLLQEAVDLVSRELLGRAVGLKGPVRR